VHTGYLEVAGRAGERLHWRFATGEAVPTEEWVTLGDDDVRRAGDVTDAESGVEGVVTDVEPDGRGGVSDAEPADGDGAGFVAEGALGDPRRGLSRDRARGAA
jgi:hypothetical protein